MSASMGQGLVVAICNSCPARRPTMSQATRRWISEKVKSLNESNVLPFHDILDAEMVNAALASAGGRTVDRLAGGQRPQALLAGDQQLLRRTPAAPLGGHR